MAPSAEMKSCCVTFSSSKKTHYYLFAFWWHQSSNWVRPKPCARLLSTKANIEKNKQKIQNWNRKPRTNKYCLNNYALRNISNNLRLSSAIVNHIQVWVSTCYHNRSVIFLKRKLFQWIDRTLTITTDRNHCSRPTHAS